MIGYVSLALALVSTLLGTLWFLLGINRNDSKLLNLGSKTTVFTFLLLTVSVSWLFYLFFTHDFQNEYVASYSSRDLPLFLLISSLWSGQQGSLLFWAWTASITAVIFLVRSMRRDELTHHTLTIMSIIMLFFMVVLNFASNPFKRLDFTPPDGAGLNPLLQDIGNWLHPLTQLIGYAGFAIPFALAMSGMITGRTDWLRKVRVWTLVAWVFLTFGIGFGAWWSYHVLGWGGYWMWDPVENATLMPWLTATAFLHSVMIEEGKKGMRTWNMLLITFTFTLVLYATLLTRSGILQSVHAFGDSPITPYFVVFIFLVLAASLFLIVTKRRYHRGKNIFEAYLSRETSFLLNNLIFVVGAFIIFTGTTFPLISEALRGYQVRIGPGYFNETAVPLAIVLFVLIGVCPLIAWRKTAPALLKQRLTHPLIAAAVVTITSFALGVRDFNGLLVAAVSSYVLFAHAEEFHRAAKAERSAGSFRYAKNMFAAVRRNQRKYGGYIVHISMIIIAIGVSWSSLYETSTMFTVGVGETYNVGSLTLQFNGAQSFHESNKIVTTASVLMYKDNIKLGEARPSISYYPSNDQYINNVYIESLPLDDLYIIFRGVDAGRATFEAKIVPLVNLLWSGLAVFVGGVIVALWPSRRISP